MSILFEITTRQAKLIEILLQTDKYLPSQYFADYLNVSKRTIFNDLVKVNDLFEEFNLIIDRKQNQGIKIIGDLAATKDFLLELVDKYQINEQKNFSSLDRQITITKWLLINGQTVTYHSMALNLFSSPSSLIKDIERIRTFLDDELKLISDGKGTRVQGKEIAIQRTIKRIVYDVIKKNQHNHSLLAYVRIIEPLFHNKVLKKVYNSLLEIILDLNLNISEQYIKSLFISLLIVTERSFRGYHLDDFPEIQLTKIKYLTKHPLTLQLCNSISSELKFNFTELEQRYISNLLYGHCIQRQITNTTVENELLLDVQNMIAGISHALEMNLQTDRKLMNSLIDHVLPMVYRLKSDIYVKNPLLNEIKNNYGVLFRIVWYSMEGFEKKYNIKLTDHDISFITIYFQVAIERKKEISQILVVCQTGLVTSDLILHRIEKLLPNNIQFKIIAKTSLKDEDLSDVNFIISSVQLKEISLPIVYVSPLVRDIDLQNIYAYYLKYSSRKMNIEEIEKNSNLISTYIHPRYVFLNEDLQTKEECLNKIIRRLEEDHIVKSSFRKSVAEREKLGNTIVQGWVAIPHAISSSANVTRISVMTTKKPIRWNYDGSVSLIILLAVAEEDLNSIRKLLSHLYKVIAKSGIGTIAQSIKSITTTVELFELLETGGGKI